MQLLHVCAIALNQTPLHWEHNLANIQTALRAARHNGAALVCLPELCISGYGCEDAFLGSGPLAQAQHCLAALLPESRGMVAAVGLPWLHGNRVYNTACLLVDGEVAGFVAKRFLAGDGIHYEPRWFHPWPLGVREETVWRDQSYPIGDIDFDVNGVRIGFEICEEAWVAARPGIRLASQGVDVILNPSASHFAFGKHPVRERFVLEGSRAFSTGYIYANLLGNEAGRVIYDGDTLLASNGRLLARGPRFSFRDWVLTDAVMDITLTRMTQARTSTFTPNPASCVTVRAADWPPNLSASAARQIAAQVAPVPAWETSAHIKEEEFTRAEALGLFDYLRKSGARGFVVSLSGGADSAATACLVRIMAELALAELQPAGVQAKLALDTPIADAHALTRHLLACVYQATHNSSPTTRHAAASLAQALNAEYVEWDVEEVVQAYVQRAARAIGRELTWQQDDLALQNIQARARAPGAWLLANLRNALLLTTGNRSEAAVGYATMDGDTSGGLSLLAGIDKHFLRQWLRWLETQGPHDLAPIPALRWVNEQQPTAELRPGHAQTDEADLMPYDFLAAVETAAIRDRRTPYEIHCLLTAEFPQYAPMHQAQWIERFFRLWSRNQWKRERLAPSFHLDDQNLDPRSWCRFPILSGGFARELAEMRTRIQADEA